MAVYHLVGRDTSNRTHPHRRAFSLQFSQLSPYAVFEIFGLSGAQQERFLKAYDVAKEVMRDLDIFPKKGVVEQERLALEIDEFERGYPRMTLPILTDIVRACLARADSGGGDRKGKKSDDEDDDAPALNTSIGADAIRKRVHAANPPGNAISWRAVLGRLNRLARLNVFYDEDKGVRPVNYADLLRPGRLTATARWRLPRPFNRPPRPHFFALRLVNSALPTSHM